MNTYEVTLHRIVEHETVYRVKAKSEDDAENKVISGYYEEVVEDSEEGEIQDPEITDIIMI